MIPSITKLTQLVNSISDDEDVNYEAYDIRDTGVYYGIPPIPIRGLDFVRAKYVAPRTRLVPHLGGGGVHVGNLNTSGVIMLGIMAGSVSGGATQAISFLGQPFPFYIEDKQSGGTSLVAAPECRLADTPPWIREARPGVDIYTFTAPRIFIIHGMRLVVDA